jgi:hypothetical protein
MLLDAFGNVGRSNAYASRPIHRLSGGVIEKHGRSTALSIIPRSLTGDCFGAQRPASVLWILDAVTSICKAGLVVTPGAPRLTVDCIVTTKPMMLPVLVLRWHAVNGELPGIALIEHSQPD